MMYQWQQKLDYWNKIAVILMKFSSLAALEVVILTTSSAASDENFVKMTIFSFQWYIYASLGLNELRIDFLSTSCVR